MVVDVLTMFRTFLESGGWVLSLIFFVAALLWTLILERWTYLRFSFPGRVQDLRRQWSQRVDRQSWRAEKILQARIAEASIELNRFMDTIKVLVAVCPLLGLLGTVTGMITVFEVMAVTGTGNARQMASGISLATIPTMAGMVIAISALFIVARLEAMAERSVQQLSDELMSLQGEQL